MLEGEEEGDSKSTFFPRPKLKTASALFSFSLV